MNRRHDLDALRAFAMLLGIALHAALSFSDGPWLVRDAERGALFGVFVTAVHGFRMPLFFLLSGYFTALVWRRRGLRMLVAQRFRRILLPLLLGLVTVIPMMVWVSDLAGERAASLPKERHQEAPTIWRSASIGDVEALGGFVESGAEIDAQDPLFGATPLSYAAMFGHEDTVAFLLERGANPRAVNRDGSTALHAAAFLGRARIAERLLTAGAEPAARNQRGETALDVARADWRTTRIVARALQVAAEEETVRQGREEVQRLLGANPSKAALEQVTRQRGAWLTRLPVFHHLWFLWFLCWMVAGFALWAWAAEKTGWTLRLRIPISSPWRYLWLLPLTMVPALFMGKVLPNFGPDTSASVFPPPHLLGYYAVFFGFGVSYHLSEDGQDALGRRWWVTLPVALLLLYPAGMMLTFGESWVRDRTGAGQGVRLAAVLLQVAYAWTMSTGLIGLFRHLLTRERAWIRYLSDASYWMYIAHLPLVIAAQIWVRDWPLAAVWKFLIVSGGVSVLLLLCYEFLVRYRWLGALLNGRKTRGHAASPSGGADTT